MALTEEVKARTDAALAASAAGKASQARATPAPPPKKKDTKRPTVTVSDAELKRAIGFPINGLHDAWSNLLHDDYYRLTEGELTSIVEPAAQIIRDHGWEEVLLRYSAPVSLTMAVVSIEADRIGYLMSDNGPESDEDFLNSKPEIITRDRPDAPSPVRVPKDEATGELNGHTSPATNIGERAPVTRDMGSHSV